MNLRMVTLLLFESQIASLKWSVPHILMSLSKPFLIFFSMHSRKLQNQLPFKSLSGNSYLQLSLKKRHLVVSNASNVDSGLPNIWWADNYIRMLNENCKNVPERLLKSWSGEHKS